MSNTYPLAEVVRLESIEITGYRSCIHTKFQPNQELSALIGINGAGKTNLLQGIRLLTQHQPRHSRRLLDDFSQSPEVQITAWFVFGGKKIGLRIHFSLDQNAMRGEDQVSVTEKWNIQSIIKTRPWIELPPVDFIDRDEKYGHLLSAKQLYLFNDRNRTPLKIQEYFSMSEEISKNKVLMQTLIEINKFRKSITYYSASQFTDPTKCPSSFEVNEEGRLTDHFSPTPNTHLRFLHSLYKLKFENSELYDSYCEFISRRQLGLVSRITWREVELSSNTAEVRSGGTVKRIKKTKTLVIPKVQIGTSHITFNQLSEGTFKTLALIFYIFTDSSQLLMVEEPEVCVHHGLLSRVVSTLKSHAKYKQTVISTHSDQLIDQLNPENVFVVEIDNSGTKVENLEKWLLANEKRALKDYLAETGTLGEYWKSGGLSR